jgi:hypothetical protein
MRTRPPSQAAIAITTATLLHHRRVRLFDLFRHLVRHLVRLFDLFRHLVRLHTASRRDPHRPSKKPPTEPKDESANYFLSPNAQTALRKDSVSGF